MKKSLFFLATAAVVLAGCNKDVKIAENVVPAGANAQKEIAFSPLSQKAHYLPGIKKAAIDGTTFPTTLDMYVAAYDATKGANFFDATTFSYADPTWKGGKYWPFAPATINFLAYADLTAGSATWNATNPASAVTLVMGDNKTAQKDLMYACGTGTVTQTGNALVFPTNVPMQFIHAQAWIKFTVKAGNAASASAITVNSITLNSVSCQGTYTVTHTNWDQTKAARDADPGKNGSVAGVWSAYDTYAANTAAVKAAGYSALSTSVQDFGSLMVVPAQGIASFTLNYTVDGKTYDYTYTPASTTLAQAYKYTYNITLTLHEIEIAPTVANWTEGGPTAVNIPE